MSKEKRPQPWHSIAREMILGYPTVNQDKYIGYELCFVTCGSVVDIFTTTHS